MENEKMKNVSAIGTGLILGGIAIILGLIVAMVVIYLKKMVAFNSSVETTNYDAYLDKFVSISFFYDVDLVDNISKKTRTIKKGEHIGGFLLAAPSEGGILKYLIQENYGQPSEAQYLIQAKDVHTLSYASNGI